MNRPSSPSLIDRVPVILLAASAVCSIGACGSKEDANAGAEAASGAEASKPASVDWGTVARVPKATLVGLLPADAAGHVRQEPGGDEAETGVGVEANSTGWAHYSGEEGADIRILIIDHPKLARIEKADGSAEGLGKFEGHQQSARQDEPGGSELKFIVADRFIVQLTGSAGIPVSTLEQVAGGMDLAGIAALAEHGYPSASAAE